jgi:hypothetical protein
VAKLFFLRFLIVVDLAYVIVASAGFLTRVTRRVREFVNFHQWSAYVFLSLFVAYIFAIEIHVRTIGGSVIDRAFCIHLGFAIPTLLLSLGLVSKFNGKQSRYHRLLAYMTGFLMIGTNVTGIPLIFSRF